MKNFIGKLLSETEIKSVNKKNCSENVLMF